MALNIAEFRRPGIFIQEIDQSIQQTPVLDTIVTLVPGFSKKGPVNRPVLVSTPQESATVFGPIDRSLEKKGSYFHRTVQTVLSQSPVFALNLLKTDDTLDLLEWKSISLSASVTNSATLKDPYSNFFNRNEFWTRDTEQFLDISKRRSNVVDKILHVTNVSDRKISLFVFKSPIKGFDVTAENWFGGRDKVPTWMYPSDLISDYMIRILVVSGDWSNYSQLAVDPRWGTYFNVSGLRKGQVTNFINDQAVTVLQQYDVSLIPYFRDLNGTDYFIETVVNRDTDVTGLFVAYDIDSLETDFPNGLIDLVGHTVVGEEQETIEYMSYKELIHESIHFQEQPREQPGNVFGPEFNYETKWITAPTPEQDFLVEPSDEGDGTTLGVSRITLDTELEIVLNGQALIIPAGQTLDIPNAAMGKIRKDTIYVDNVGQLGVLTGFEQSNYTEWESVPVRAVTDFLFPIAIVEVGTSQTSEGGSGTSGTSYQGVANTGAIQVIENLIFADNGTNGGDIVITPISSYEMLITFANTLMTDPNPNYRKTRAQRIFNELQNNLEPGTSIVRTNNDNYAKIQSVEFTNTSSENLAVKITVSPNHVIDYPAEIYFEDNAFILGSKGVRTSGANGDYGKVSHDSAFYQAYRDGMINSGDYFLQNITDSGATIPVVQFFKDEIGQSIITMYSQTALFAEDDEIDSQGGDRIYISGTGSNDGFYTVLNSTIDEPNNDGYPIGTESYNFRTTVYVDENVVPETSTSGNVTLHDGNPDSFVYLKMYTINDDLFVDFVNSPDLATAGSQTIDINNNKNLVIFSRKSNFKQTLEVEAVLELNRFLIKANRYGEVKVGDYVSAYIPSDIEPGSVPKKLTRVIAKRAYATDPTLMEITTDSQVDFLNFEGDRQVLRYTRMEDYVTTYQAITLSGFKIRPESMPDGSEVRQDQILNMLAPGTPIFKGLTNRNRISWRYLVDSFGNGMTANSKQQLVDLCGARLNTLGLLNMPSAKAFKNSTNPSFLDPFTNTLSAEFVRLGGNPESNPAFMYSFGQGVGQSNVAYFFPYVTISDLGRPVQVPPAMFAANTFLRKHSSRRSDVHPWTIAAGLTNGIITGFGDVEIDITDEELEDYNVMGANVIQFRANQNFVIATNNTAQSQPQTALSKIHVREALIELENDIYNVLVNYQWRFNTAAVRAEIKDRIDRIGARYVSTGALNNFFSIVDETNNTGEVIDAGIGVIDVFVEPVRGLEVLVSRVTILRTNAIEIGEFAIAQA